MYHRIDDTIAAIATAPGGAARGIVRISGPHVVACLEQIFAADNGARLDSVRSTIAIPGQCSISSLAAPLPCRLYLWPGLRSYTRQPLAELHTLGSPPLLEALLQSLSRHGARLAAPGEFTLRAFLAGRIDLTQAEAVLGVIDAAGGQQLDAALAQLAGGLATPLVALREKLLDLLAHLEAGLDFVEEDISFISHRELARQLAECQIVVDEILKQMSQRAAAADEPLVALIGLANAGKSSLLNALAGDAAAIVSPVAGTTRDYVARRVNFEGVECVLVDTAGIEAASGTSSIADHAQRMASEQSRRAEIQLCCIDSSRGPTAWESEQLAISSDHRIVVLTKCDLSPAGTRPASAIATSSVTGEGLAELRSAIATAIAAAGHDSSRVVAATAARCREGLDRAATNLQTAQQLVAHDQGEELIAAELRAALKELGQVIGVVYTDDILDRIFSRFCIGK